MLLARTKGRIVQHEDRALRPSEIVVVIVFALVAFCCWRILTLESRIAELVDAQAAASAQAAESRGAASDAARRAAMIASQANNPAVANGDIDAMSAQILMQIAALSEKVDAVAAGTTRAPVSAPPATKQTDALYDRVQNDLRAIAARGAVNELELTTLQTEIAKLPVAQRNAALSELSRVMSNSNLDGQFN